MLKEESHGTRSAEESRSRSKVSHELVVIFNSYESKTKDTDVTRRIDRLFRLAKAAPYSATTIKPSSLAFRPANRRAMGSHVAESQNKHDPAPMLSGPNHDFDCNDFC